MAGCDWKRELQLLLEVSLAYVRHHISVDEKSRCVLQQHSHCAAGTSAVTVATRRQDVQ